MKNIVIFLIKVWQFLRPIRHQLNISAFGFSSVCRQKISCSDYVIQQINKHGTILGLKKSIFRVSQCHSSNMVNDKK